jgi:hypothetical protein
VNPREVFGDSPLAQEMPMRRNRPTPYGVAREAVVHPVIVSTLCAILLTWAGPFPLAQDGAPSYATAEPRPWDFCLVCDRAIGKTDRVYEVEGQRVPVHTGACDERFKENPDRYLAKLKPRGAFLGAEPGGHQRVTLGWLLLGLYAISGLVFAGLCAYRAINRCLRPVPWFFWGFFFNALAYLVLMTRPFGFRSGAPSGVPQGLAKVPLTYSPEPCASCGEMNHPSATSCSACGQQLVPRVASEVERARI